MPENLRVKASNFIDETTKISFKFNGKTYYGFKGDTLASALISNNIHLVGRSFKYRSEERRVGKECRSRWSPYH